MLIIVGATLWYVLRMEQKVRTQALATQQEEIQALREQLATLFDAHQTLTSAVVELEGENSQLAQRLEEEQERVQSVANSVSRDIERVSSTVGDLEKLSKTDPELLQKYSKVFFLNEHYQPAQMVEIDKRYLYNEAQTLKIHADVWPHLKKLFDAAKKDGIELYAKSAFRSFNEQANVKGSHTVTYGAGTANTFSADQGYSEHQLGTTVDFITTGLQGQLDGFDTTPAYQWMLKNAHRYGFTLSYPQGNAYYIYEPWHWRFVGEKLAEDLHDDGKHFYDLDQREIDKYLIDLF